MTVPTERKVVAGFRLGAHPPKIDKRTVQLSRAAATLPTPPATVVNSNHVPVWPMFRNDELGDCAIAGPAHEIEAWTADAGAEHSVTDADVVKAYSAVGGYVPGDPSTDNGCVILDVLNYWRKVGIGGDRIAGYAKVTITNHTLVRQAIWLFGGINVGLALPASAEGQVDNGLWFCTSGPDAAPGTWGGHCVPVLDYTAQRLSCVTWGRLLPMTWGFFLKYCTEAYVPLSTDWLNKATQRSPGGVDLSTMQADLAKFH